MPDRPPRRLEHAAALLLEQADRVLQSPTTKLALSFLIVLSVVPAHVLAARVGVTVVELDLAFLSIFAPEFVLRVVTWALRARQGRARPWEPVLLLVDCLALLSFLPLHALLGLAYLRVLRLTRLLLLIGYWGDMLADLWVILSGRERRFQVVFVLLLGLVLSLAGSVILLEAAPTFDFNEDGVVDALDQAFPTVLWWSFRQVQDPGNLAASPSQLPVVVVSLGLTFAGFLLFGFFIGISTGAMEELMARSRDRPVGLRDHTVILGLGPSTHFLLEELAEIYRKNRKQVKGALLGSEEETPEYFHRRGLRGFRYRAGESIRVADLDKVDVDRAKRILVLGPGGESPDAQVISSILSVRARNRSAQLFPDLQHEKNFSAARTAGGERTAVIGSGPFLGYYVAQCLVYPGAYRVCRQLLTTSGAEIYTYLPVSRAERERWRQGEPVDFAAASAEAQRAHGVTLLGFFVSADGREGGEVGDYEVLLNPAAPAVRGRCPQAFDPGGRVRRGHIRGLIALCLRWADLQGFARTWPDLAAPAEPPAPPAEVLPALALPGGRIGRLLVCGAGLRVPRVVSELADFYGHLDVTILVRLAEHVPPLVDGLRAALGGYLSGVRSLERVWTLSAPAPGELRGESRDGGEVKVRVLNLDWSDASVLLHHPLVDLARADALAFLPRDESDEADGLVALDCLRMAHFALSGAWRTAPGFRVVGTLRDPVKSDLLEARLDAMAGEGWEDRFTVVSTERVRHHFMVQNIFVPGLNTVLLELLGASGQHLCRLVPQAAGGAFQPRALARALLRERGLILLGWEAAGEQGMSVELEMGHRESQGPVAWSGVRALYVVGDGRALLDPGRNASS